MLKARSCAVQCSVLSLLAVLVTGCVSIKAPENISVGDRPREIDSSRVPATRSHEEARQRLAEAYERNRYLEAKVDELEREKDELEDERDDYKRRYERLKD